MKPPRLANRKSRRQQYPSPSHAARYASRNDRSRTPLVRPSGGRADWPAVAPATSLTSGPPPQRLHQSSRASSASRRQATTRF
jgi:hypothetical protein